MIFLDTSVCVAFLRGNVDIRKRLRNFPVRTVGISSISLMELEKGIAAGESQFKSINRAGLKSLLDNVAVYDFDSKAARIAARLLVKFKVQGRERGFFDLLIAAHANAQAATLVTCDGGQSGIARQRQLWPKGPD